MVRYDRRLFGFVTTHAFDRQTNRKATATARALKRPFINVSFHSLVACCRDEQEDSGGRRQEVY